MLWQVVGCKYVRLYAPDQSARVFPRSPADPMSNTARLKPADIVAGEAAGAFTHGSEFAAFTGAAYVEAVLNPGDILYIPRGWWHFVKSLSISISIAFHFR